MTLWRRGKSRHNAAATDSPVPLWICSSVFLADVIDCNNMLMQKKTCKSFQTFFGKLLQAFATVYFTLHVDASGFTSLSGGNPFYVEMRLISLR